MVTLGIDAATGVLRILDPTSEMVLHSPSAWLPSGLGVRSDDMFSKLESEEVDDCIISCEGNTVHSIVQSIVLVVLLR